MFAYAAARILLTRSARRRAIWMAAGTALMIAGCQGEQANVTTRLDDNTAGLQTAREAAVAYVGDAACTACHEDIATDYRQHSMGRSLTPLDSPQQVAQVAHNVNREDNDNARNVFTAGGFRYEVLHKDGKVFHRQSRVADDGGELAVIEEQIQYAIGSGHHGQSYLVDRDGFLFMSPITWYPDKQIWDLSPGYHKTNSQFNRPVIEICLYCHANRAPRVPYTTNRYAQPPFEGFAIGCERCHGPGAQHVSLHQAGDVVDSGDHKIVNPARLEPALREAVCQQCHLSGVARVLKPGRSLYDYRPGQSPDTCFSTFVLRPELVDNERLVGQVEQMYQSRCYQGSDGKLGCISCHDPHRLPTAQERTAFYRDRCLQCHPPDDCQIEEPARKEANQDSCMVCHMPRHETEVRHASAVNHRIPQEQRCITGDHCGEECRATRRLSDRTLPRYRRR